MKKTLANVLDIIGVLSSAFLIILFVIVLAGTLRYFSESFLTITNMNQKYFFLGLVISIVTVTTEWIWNLTQGIIKTLKDLNKKNKTVKEVELYGRRKRI